MLIYVNKFFPPAVASAKMPSIQFRFSLECTSYFFIKRMKYLENTAINPPLKVSSYKLYFCSYKSSVGQTTVREDGESMRSDQLIVSAAGSMID